MAATTRAISAEGRVRSMRTFTEEEVEEMVVSEPQTNADRIRSMSDEELAELLDSVDNGGIRALDVDYPCDECTQKTKCDECFIEWLQSEVEE